VLQCDERDLMWTAIGVTERIDREQLLQFASAPHYVAIVQSYQQLATATQLTRNAMLAHCGRVTDSFTGKSCLFVCI